MFGIKEPNFVSTEEPQNITESFSKTLCTPKSAAYCLMKTSPGPTSSSPNAYRLLDAVSEISLCQRENVSATMASLTVNEADKDTLKSVLETGLYIIFNHEDDEAAGSCAQHLQFIFDMLCQVPYKLPSMEGSRKVISKELKNNLIEICRAIHNHSFEIFAYRVTKRKHNSFGHSEVH